MKRDPWKRISKDEEWRVTFTSNVNGDTEGRGRCRSAGPPGVLPYEPVALIDAVMRLCARNKALLTRDFTWHEHLRWASRIECSRLTTWEGIEVVLAPYCKLQTEGSKCSTKTRVTAARGWLIIDHCEIAFGITAVTMVYGHGSGLMHVMPFIKNCLKAMGGGIACSLPGSRVPLLHAVFQSA